MGLRLYANAHAFGDALAESKGRLYSICNSERLDPAEVLRLEQIAHDHGHHDLSGVTALRAEAQREIESYFDEAARNDPKWLFAYSSKVVLSIPEYQDLQKVFLLRSQFTADTHAGVLLLVPDVRLRRLLAELFSGARPTLSLPLPGAHAWGRFARTLLRAFCHRVHDLRARVLIFTLSSGAPRPGTDAYFGNFAAALGERATTLTVYLASGPQLRLPRDAVTAPVESFVSAWSVVSTWLSAILSGPAAASAPRLAGNALAPLHRYMRRAEIRSGEYFMQRLIARGFGAMLDQVSPEVLVYPFENRSWEKHLLAQATARAIPRRIAYQHSSITPRHLAFHIRAGEIADEHLPDRVVTIGERTAVLLRGFAPALADRIAVGASMRTARQAVANARAPGVLVAISSSRNEAWSLLQVTHAAATRIDIPFTIRTHPTIPVDEMFALFRWPPNVRLSTGRSLADDLSRVTLVAYSSSTVALEGMLHGRLPIFVDIGDCPSGDPIIGDHPFKFQARSGAALADEVERIVRLDATQFGALQSAARTFSESYLRAPTPEAVRDMAESVLRP